jgi:hypothetical protein
MTEFPQTKAEAAAQAAGYLFQLRFALFRALKRLRRDPTGSIAIERIDDIAIQSGSTIVEIGQLKHTADPTIKFNDMSPPVWRTIGNWSRLVAKQPELNLAILELILITNASIEEGCGLSYLGLADEDRNSTVALKKLKDAAFSSQNQKSKNDRDAFLGLESEIQTALVRAIRVAQNSPNLDALGTEIEDILHYSCENTQLSDFRAELEGWWFDRVAEVMSTGLGPVLSLLELDARVGYLREKYKTSALQIDVDDPNEEPENLDEYMFVKQVKALNVREQRIRNVQRDFLKASAQRSKWLRETRIDPAELDKYDNTLHEHWTTQSAIINDEMSSTSSDDDKRKCGRNLLAWAETQQTPIRGATAQFLTSGSYHTLSDQLRLGWHPDFLKLFGGGHDPSSQP